MTHSDHASTAGHVSYITGQQNRPESRRKSETFPGPETPERQTSDRQ